MAKLQHPLTALYYPDFEPDPAWLRAQLLFFDKVESIIPTDVEWTPDPLNDALFQKKPKLFAPIRKTVYLPGDYRLDLPTFDRACKLIKEEYGAADPREIEFQINKKTSERQVDRRSWLHNSKLNPAILTTLRENGLVIEEKGLSDAVIGRPNFVLADEHASCLVVGMIAEHIAGNRAARCITRQALPHYFNVCNASQTSPGARGVVEGALAAFTMKLLVPRDIEQMPLDKYLELRDRHTGLRESYRRCLKQLYEDWDFASMTSPETIRETVKQIGSDLANEVEAARAKAGLRTAVNEYGPFYLSAGCRLIPVFFHHPVTVAATALIGVSMHVLDRVSRKPAPGEVERTVKMMADLRDDLDGRSKVQRLLGTGVPKTPRAGGR